MRDVPTTQMKVIEAIRNGLDVAMDLDPHLICYGLGIDDPKRIFGSTVGLAEKFGNGRVFDVPTSEAAMTGIAVGAALRGVRSVTVHQRLDFFFLAMDQLINNVAKWHFMFGGQRSVPIVIRLILGRGWGQGPTHSQSVHSWFAHIPGLKVVMPTNAADAKGVICAAKNEGRHEKSLEIARKMLSSGFSFDQVVQMTGLSEKDIKSLQG